MNLPADAPFVSRPAPRLAAGVLALGVHVVFVLLLVFGVSWQTQHPAPVMVDLWETLPKVAPSVAVKPPEPPPPLPVKTPEPVKAAPAPKPVVDEPPLPKAPDIALEKKKAEAERLQKLKAIQAEEEQARAEAARKAHEKQLAEQKKRELLRQMEEDLMQRTADEEAASAALAMKQAAERAAAGKRQAELARVVGQHRDQISAKVRGNTRLPDNLKGNPEVRCVVRLLPTGEVQSVRVTQSSGNAAYDEAVVRAIEKSSPLPLPVDRDARAAFVPELSFVHRPKE
ncbi:MAG TPA: TonB family protein [Thiobacillus sp.]|nr:TonB family protein [Thiobacillus sp.]